MFLRQPKTMSSITSQKNLSMTKQSQQINQQTSKQNSLSIQPGMLGVSNQSVQYFSFRLKNQVSQTDPTVAWQYNVPYLNPNQKNLYLATQSFSAILQGYIGDDYPQTIQIGLMNYGGFIGFTGTPTNRIIILNLDQITTYSQNGYTSRDLVYKNQTSAMWPLGGLRNLTFKVYLDQGSTAINFPIVNPLAICFKIVHLSV